MAKLKVYDFPKIGNYLVWYADSMHARVIIKGGLGNQLFQLSKAMELSKEFSRTEILDDANNHQTRRVMYLNEICKQERFQSFTFSKVKLLDSVRVSLAHKSKVLPKGLGSMLRSILGVVFDADIPKIVLSRNIFGSAIFDGYWQKEAKTEELEAILYDFLQNEVGAMSSSAYVSDEVPIPLVIHVRGQDFLMDDRNFTRLGVLSPDYYRSAMDACLPQIQAYEVKIVTDDEALARTMFPELDPSNIFGPQRLNVFDSLKYMSLAPVLIVGNSTLAWWASTLASRSNAIVCVPKNWRRDGRDFCPPRVDNAIEITSKWLSVKPALDISENLA